MRNSLYFICILIGLCQRIFEKVLVTHKLSGFVAQYLSGLLWSPKEVTDETDRDTTGDPDDAI